MHSWWKVLEPPQNDDNRKREYPPLPIVGAFQTWPPGLVVVSPFYFGRQSREFVMTYSEKLKDPRWQKLRLRVLEMADWKCQRCSCATKPLHVHHTAYGMGEPWEIDTRFLKVLCEDCHGQEHSRELWLKREGLQEWPLTLPGQEHFFGYVTAMGVLCDDYAPEGFFSTWVEFSYGEHKDRYDVPTDSNLLRQLWEWMLCNMETTRDESGLCGKVWVRLTDKGYEVDLP
jgi:hypothetical protein